MLVREELGIKCSARLVSKDLLLCKNDSGAEERQSHMNCTDTDTHTDQY
jgi:hypothetical protein